MVDEIEVQISVKLNESVIITEDNITVYQQSWEAERDDVKLSSHIDRWFYLTELLIFIIGIYLTVEKYPHRNKVWKDTWNIAKFEFNSEIKTNRTMILIIFFRFGAKMEKCLIVKIRNLLRQIRTMRQTDTGLSKMKR